ncbi:MAG TPA: carboxypeptidase-like regulatory domain-containing protein [Gemmatimonadaceae bacterium]|jgi:hypothetical protein
MSKWMHCIAMLALLRVGRAGAQASATELRREIVQGRATRDGVIPVPAADVVITMAPDRKTFQTRSDSTGRFRAVVAEGTGDYLVHVGKIGLTPFRKRYTRGGADTVFNVDARMPPIAPVLDAVEVIAARSKPPRTAPLGTQTGASEQISEGISGTLSPEMQGDLTSIAQTVPGITIASDGNASAFGLTAAANAVTLNGMAFAGADIPRDANVETKVSTSAYDPSRGWFSGVQTTVELRQGAFVSRQRAHIAFDTPSLQYGDPISARIGQRVAKVDLSWAGEGPFGSSDRFLYNYAIQASRATANSSTIFSADPFLLQHAGVSADSATRFAQVLQQSGIPVAGSLSGSRRVNDNLSFILRLDDAPFDWNSAQTTPATVKALTMYGKVTRVDGLALTPTSTIGHAGENRQALGMIQGLYSTYVNDIYLVEGRSAFTFGETRLSPYLSIPEGHVLVASTLPSSTDAVTDLAFGGNGAFATTTRRWTWETTSSAQMYASTGKQPHRVKVDADARLDGLRQIGSGSLLGTFQFNSLDDLAGGHPTGFSRTLNSPVRDGSEWNSFAAVGDEWRLSKRLQVLYGARLEGNVFNAAPAYNAAIEQAFGLRTDHVPNTWAVSPRAGFTWVLHPSRGERMETDLGKFTAGPTAFVRGGVGLFRSMLSPSLLSDAFVTTGLPGGARRIVCIGDAIPTPDWSAYAASSSTIPTSCVAGTSSAFSDGAPPVVAFDRAFTAPRSWRGNLAVSDEVRGIVLGVEGTYSLNRNQPSVINVNLRTTPQFTVAGEGRPVFVPTSAIVASSGAVSAAAARTSAAFAGVFDNRSDLKSTSRQITFSARPTFAFFEPGSIWSRMYASLAYTLGDVRAQQRGFDGSTFGDPSTVSWGRGDLDVRYSILSTFGMSAWGASVTLYARLNSGLPFTPIVAQDVNGDGQANDRAFIFDPATVSDSRLASSLHDLITTAPASVRSCLSRQLDQSAGRNSCEAPWSSAMNARISLPGRLLRLPSSVSEIALNLANPLGGLDQVLHGSDHLRGWGTRATVDPVLYTVRGFDPASQRYSYTVNPRFGATDASVNTLRAPFRLTLDVSINLGRAPQAQLLERWLNQGRAGRSGTKLEAADLLRRYARTVPDPYNQTIRQADSLLLTPDQVARLRSAQTVYQAKMTAHWTELATYLASLPDHYTMSEAYRRQETMTDSAWAIAWRDVHQTFPGILTPIQLRMLPELVAILWAEPAPPRDLRIISLRGP